MTQPLLRDLIAFAHESGYDAAPCPGCALSRVAADRCCTGACTNCGGSGRLWTSQRGSLSDDGLQRLRWLL